MKPSDVYKTKPIRDELDSAIQHLRSATSLANKAGLFDPEELHEALEAIYHYISLITQESP